jgi:hypothetical protein
MNQLKFSDKKILNLNVEKEPLWIFIIFHVVSTLNFIMTFNYVNQAYGTNIWNRHYSGKFDLRSIYLPFSNWDGQHYLILAEKGYDFSERSQAFFPLYPMTIKLINQGFDNVYLSAFILNTITTYLLINIFWKYCKHHLDNKNSIRCVIFLLCYPSSFYITAFYTEGLFLLILFNFLYQYEVKKSYKICIFGMLMPLARGQALFFFVGLIILIIIRKIKKEKINFKYEIIVLFSLIIGWLLYFGFMDYTTGSYLSGLNAQKLYDFGNSLANIINPSHFVEYLLSNFKGRYSYTNSLTDKLFIIFGLVSMFLVLKSKYTNWIVYYIVFFFPVASMGLGGSFVRFSLLMIPFLSLVIWKEYPKNHRLIYYTMIVFIYFHIHFSQRFILNLWIG